MSKKKKLSWTIEPVRNNVHIIRFDDIKPGWSQRFLITGDRHWDSFLSQHKLQIQHLDEAKEEEAPIIDVGDFFDAMEGKFDPRKHMDVLRPELKREDYYDALPELAENFFFPYADLFAVIGMGNHETKVLKHQQINLINNFVRRLQKHSSSGGPYNGQYSGWILFRLRTSGGRSQTIKLKYHHGHGGGGPVTKGVIQTNRRAVYLPDADIVATAHIHESWVINIPRERINQKGTIYAENQTHVSVPTYKEEFFDQSSGFHIETGRPPKPIGCTWLTLYLPNGGDRRVRYKIENEV